MCGYERQKRCKSKVTGEIKFIDADNIPDDYYIFINRKDNHVSVEQKCENRKKLSKRNSLSKWFNNGIEETFCLPEKVKPGFVRGRLPGLNAGRKYSAETLQKMSNTKNGTPASNKNKISITNGIINKYINKNEIIPDGQWHGMTRINKEN